MTGTELLPGELMAGGEIPDRGNDSVLVHQLQAGDPAALAGLMALYQKGIYKLAYRFFSNQDDALEIVQETFIKLHEHAQKLQPESNVKQWLSRVAYHCCVDYYRKFKKKKLNDLDYQELHLRLNSPQPQPEEHWRMDRVKLLMRKSLEKLSPRQRVIFSLKHFEEMKYEEISATLNISVGTIKSLHHRAFQSLRRYFLQTGGRG